MLQLLHWFLKIPPPGGDSGQWHPGWGSTSTFNAVVFPFCFIMFWPDKSLVVASCPLLGIPSPFLGQPANHQNSRALGNGSSPWSKYRKFNASANGRRNRPFHLTEREGQGRVNHQWWCWFFWNVFWGGASFSLVCPYISPHTVMNDKHYECLKSLGYMYMMKWSCTNWLGTRVGKVGRKATKERIQKTVIFII